MPSKKTPITVLISPLDWGLGHATRCIPIIRELLEQGCKVFIAAEGATANLLKAEFPNVSIIPLRGYHVQLPTAKLLPLYFAWHLPRLAWRVVEEHFALKRIIKEHHIDVVISDNRYGLWNSNICSVLITHQVNIIPPRALRFTAPLLRRITRFFINKFDHCWIPDNGNEPSLAGELSHGHGISAKAAYVGMLSRFDRMGDTAGATVQGYDVVALVSGPEPQRSVFESLLTSQLNAGTMKSLLLRGVPGDTGEVRTMGNLTIMNHLDADHLYRVLKASRVVVCRGGYSTLMDLAFTGNKVICIPTPGQTEQEYLARRGAQANLLVHADEDNLRLDECIERAAATTGINVIAEPAYREVIANMLCNFITLRE